jgi:hypothetical protein
MSSGTTEQVSGVIVAPVEAKPLQVWSKYFPINITMFFM